MYFLARLIPTLNAIFALLVIELAIRQPARFVDLVMLGFVGTVVGMIIMLHRATNAERLTLIGLGGMFFLGTSFLEFFLSAGWLRHVIAGLTAVTLWVFLEEAYRYIYQPERYHRHALDHLGALLGVAAITSAMAGIFGLRIFLTVRLIVLLPATFFLVAITTAAVLATHPMPIKKLIVATVFFGIIVTEVAWAVLYLPTHYWVNALFVAIPFYVALHLVRHEISGTLTRRHIRRYAVVALTAIIIVASTAQWVV
ncbi:MAG: hypothetical protein HY976_02320 [Candidatus Kerfeldbacteria bacterium]|nr:hypothetical protein [Candidatus Kerfeldbacteria bacterium]